MVCFLFLLSYVISDFNGVCLTDKTIKLWKIGAQKRFIPRCADNFMSRRQISLPVLDESTPVIDSLQAIAKRIYANAHAYHINSLALCTDNESFFSADDLRVNWWRIDSSDTAFSKFLPSL